MPPFDVIRAALAGALPELSASALDRVAAAAVAEIAVASIAPVPAVITGAEWVTVKAHGLAGGETIGSLKRGAAVLVGAPEAGWRPVYGTPLGWISANLAQVLA